MPRFTFIFGVIILVFVASLSLAGIPKLINYQGMLTDNANTPLNGTYSIIFKIYNDQSAGTKKWEETQSSVSVANGLFNVILGSVNPIDSLDFNEQYWLDITVGGEQMPSRLKFTSVGYAYRAMIADSAVVAVSAPTGGGWTDEGTKVRLASSSDSVGIGTTTPQAKLHISGGDLLLDYVSGIRMIQGNGYPSTITKFGNDIQFNNFATGYIDFRTGTSLGSATARLHITHDGKIGIGTIEPAQSLHVHGSAPADANDGQLAVSESSSGSNRLLLIGRTSSYGFIQSHNQQPLVLNPIANNVGIGTTNPSKKLHVISTTTNDAVYGDNTSSYNTYGFLGGSVGAYGQYRGNGNCGYLGTLSYGVIYTGGLAGSGSKSCIVKTSKGPTLLYCQESPENWFEDFGEGQLDAGRCHVELDPLFLETITIDDQNPMKVFVQLVDDCNGIYVQRGKTGFDVIELKGGQTNARFTYRVVAKRSGFEDKRLDVCEAGRTDPYLYPEIKEKADRQ